MTGRRRSRIGRLDQDGQILVWTVILLPVLLALVGLVLDGGLMYVQFRRARWAVDGAAVAAASAIDLETYRESGQVVLGSDAEAAARAYAHVNHPGLVVDDVQVGQNVVYVRGRVAIEPVFLKMIGVRDFEVRVVGHERPAWGAAREGQ